MKPQKVASEEQDVELRLARKWLPGGQEVGPGWIGSGSLVESKWILERQEVGPRYTPSGLRPALLAPPLVTSLPGQHDIVVAPSRASLEVASEASSGGQSAVLSLRALTALSLQQHRQGQQHRASRAAAPGVQHGLDQ